MRRLVKTCSISLLIALIVTLLAGFFLSSLIPIHAAHVCMMIAIFAGVFAAVFGLSDAIDIFNYQKVYENFWIIYRAITIVSIIVCVIAIVTGIAISII